MPDQPNVALVVLDTLRKDAFDDQFDWLPGRRYEQAWAPSHWTVPVHGSLFGGKYPSELGVHAKSKRFDCPEPALAESLSDAGYTTRAFSNNVNISPRNDFDRGFDEFEGGWRLSAIQHDEELFDWGEFVTETADDSPLRYLRALAACARSDAPTVESLKWGLTMKLHDFGLGPHGDDGAKETLSYLEDLAVDGAGEFLFVNLMEAHLPYSAPRSYLTTRVDRVDSLTATVDEPAVDGRAARQAYDDCVRYLSDVYRDIHDVLEEKYDYVVTLSDHGELFGEHGAWVHSYGVYPELTHVPLVVSGPGVESGTTDVPVSLLDVHRTVLDLAGVDGESTGESLLDPPAGRAPLTEYHGLDEHQRESLRKAGFEEGMRRMDEELFGFAERDYYGYETLDGWAEEGTTDGDPRERLESLREPLDVRTVTEGGSEPVEAGVRSQLRDLGYM